MNPLNMKIYKVLNLYACLGGNRYKWDEVAEKAGVKLEIEKQNSWFSNTIRFMVLSMISNAKLYGIKTKYKNTFLFNKEYSKYITHPRTT